MINEGDIKVGDRTYHVAVNWNSVCGFLTATGNDTMEAVANIGAIKPSQMPVLVSECIKEGERLQGRECNISPMDVGALFGALDMTEFIKIFSRSMTPSLKKKE